MRTLSALCLGLFLIAGGCVHAAEHGQAPVWRAAQEIWWTTPSLVKNAIVAYLRFLDGHPDLQQAPSPRWEIVSLVLILGDQQTPEALKALSDLTSYYLGESGDEVLHCVIMRTGQKLEPLLQERLTSKSNDCQGTLGADSKLCLTQAAYRSALEGTIAAIKRDERCYIER